MAANLEEITKEVVELPRHYRLALVRLLLDLDQPGTSDEIDSVWVDEIRARVKAVDEGRVEGIPYEQVKKDMGDRFDTNPAPGRGTPPPGMENFMRVVQADDTPQISPQHFGKWLEIGMPRLAQLARVHRTTIYKAPATEQLQSYLRNVIKVLAAATAYSGNLTRAIYSQSHRGRRAE